MGTDETVVVLPDGLDVRQIRIRWGEVSLFDQDGQESVLISRMRRDPGAGMDVNFADHVKIQY